MTSTNTSTNPLPNRNWNWNRRSAYKHYLYKHYLYMYSVVLLFLLLATATATNASDNQWNDNDAHVDANVDANVDVNANVNVDRNINMNTFINMDGSMDSSIANPTPGFEQLIAETDRISQLRTQLEMQMNVIPSNSMDMETDMETDTDTDMDMDMFQPSRHLEQDADPDEEVVDDMTINDDTYATLVLNPNFAKCNQQTADFYNEYPDLYQAVEIFAGSSEQTWGGPDRPLDLILEFNATLKDAMKEACTNSSGYFAFAGNIDCTYMIQQVPPREDTDDIDATVDIDIDAAIADASTEPPSLELKNFTVHTNITNYANCVADTEACRNIDGNGTDFLQIVMHSLGSACKGMQRDDAILQRASGHTRTAFGALASAWALALVLS